jgi:hypothetical protein
MKINRTVLFWHYLWPSFLIVIPFLLIQSFQGGFTKNFLIALIPIISIQLIIARLTSGQLLSWQIHRRPFLGAVAIGMIQLLGFAGYSLFHEAINQQTLGGVIWLLGWTPYWLLFCVLSALVTNYFHKRPSSASKD